MAKFMTMMAVLCVAVSGAIAQSSGGAGGGVTAACDTWTTVTRMGDSLGTGIIIDQLLDDNTEFSIYASASAGLVIVDLDGLYTLPINGWTQDNDGVATVTNGSLTVTFRCQDGLT